MAKITGIGGVFFRCDNVLSCIDNYRMNFNFITNEYGALLAFQHNDKIAYTQWSPFPEETLYFPTEQRYMVNFRVDDLIEFKQELTKKNISILDEIEEFEYGKFLHIQDAFGIKIELWEPVDEVFTDLYKQDIVTESVLDGITIQHPNFQKMNEWYAENLFNGRDFTSSCRTMDNKSFRTSLTFSNDTNLNSANGISLDFKTNNATILSNYSCDGFGNTVRFTQFE